MRCTSGIVSGGRFLCIFGGLWMISRTIAFILNVNRQHNKAIGHQEKIHTRTDD